MAFVHLFMQGKGGIGKTVCCSQFAQFIRDTGNDIFCLDCDPVNHSFSQYKDLNVTMLNLFYDDVNVIDSSKFDDLIYLMEDIKSKEDAEREATPDNFAVSANVVIDTGASTFLPLLEYLQSGAFQAIHDLGHKLFIHNVIAGGDNVEDTVLGLETVVEGSPEFVNIVVWKNLYFGPIAYEEDIEKYIANHKRLDPKSPTYKDFEKFPIYKKYMSRFFAIIHMKKFHFRTEASIREMLKFKLTFRTILTDQNSPYRFNILERQTIKNVRDDLYNQLNAIDFN